MNSQTQTLAISASAALAGVLVGAAGMGLMSHLETPAAPQAASSALPSSLNIEDFGEGGLVADSIIQLTESEHYAVWSAVDRAGNTCEISVATPEGNTGVACVDKTKFEKIGLSASMQVGMSEQGDLSVVVLQTYLIPDGINAAEIAQQIPGSEVTGQLVVRYGKIDLEISETITAPSSNGDFQMVVYGRDTI